MKVAQLTKLMNDHGTKPRVRVLRHYEDYNMLVYEGHPDRVDAEAGQLKVNSFTVLGKGLIEIHAQ